MSDQQPPIWITVLSEEREDVIETYAYEYRNLMMLINDKLLLENFGECKGTGRCGTCHIHVLSPHVLLADRQGNEQSTLGKIAFATPNSRLSCQIMIDFKLNGAQIELISDDVSSLK
jgi:ferredoxin, 2Fe-2S